MNWITRLWGRREDAIDDRGSSGPSDNPPSAPKSVIVETCESLNRYAFPEILNRAKTHLNMRGWMKPSTLEAIIVDTRALLARDACHQGAVALLGYAVLALRRPADGAECFERAKSGGVLCGHYFSALASYLSKVDSGDVQGAGTAMVDAAMLFCIDGITDQSTLQLDMKSLKLGHCIIVSTAHGGLVVAVEGHEERFRQNR